MRQLVSYTCSACGGALTVDRKQEVFECPFCGNAFDFVQLHYDELMKEAATNMRQMEFIAAKEKYNSVLSYTPQDFQALRGLVLCDGKLISSESLKKIEKMKKGSIREMNKSLEDIKARASEDAVPYFEKLSEMTELAQKHIELEQEKEKFVERSRQEFGNIVSLDYEKESFKEGVEGFLRVLGAIPMLLISDVKTDEESEKTAGLIVLFLVCLGVAAMILYKFGRWAALIFAGIIAAIAVMIKLIGYIEDKRKAPMRARMRENHRAEAIINSKIRENEKDYEAAFRRLNQLEPGGNLKD